MPPTLREIAAIKRGDVLLVDLRDAKGQEQTKIRRAIVVSANFLHNGPLLIVVPASSFKGQELKHYEVLLDKDADTGFTKESFAQPQQVRTIDKDRILEILGRVSDGSLGHVTNALEIVLGIESLE